MRRPRFTISGLLILIALLGVAFAALRAADDAWDSALFGVTLLALLTSALLAVHREEGRRAYWLGFALFGWGYLLASQVPQVEPRLPTTKWLAYLDSKVPGRANVVTFTVTLANPSGSNAAQTVAFPSSGGTLATTLQGAVRLWDATAGRLLAGPGGSTENFVRIGHSLLALVVAVAGGGLSRRLSASGPRDLEGERVVRPSDDVTEWTP